MRKSLKILASVMLLAIPTACTAPAHDPAQHAALPTSEPPGENRAKATPIPVYIGRNPALIPQNDTVITQIIPLERTPPGLLAANLAVFLGPNGQIGPELSGGAMDALVITDTSARIHLIAEIVRTLDDDSNIVATVKSRQLQFANAPDAAVLLTRIFAPSGRPPTPPERERGRLYADADARTNTVLVRGRPDEVELAIKTLDNIDVQAAKPRDATPASRSATTIPLSGDALAAELDHRFNIWFVGTKIPDWATITLPENATADEALTLLRKTLARDNGGFQVTDVPGSTNTVFQLSPSGTKPLPCRYGTDETQIPVTDDRVTQIIPLVRINAEGVRADLEPMFATDGDLSANRPHNCLIATDISRKINRLVQIINKLDLPPDPTTASRQLKSADVAETALLLNTMLYPSGRQGRPELTLNYLFYADYDLPTKTVYVAGYADQVKQALDMIDRLDVAAATATASPPATRAAITTPLAGDAITTELRLRFGIWIADGGPIPNSVTVTLPANATPDEALALLRAALAHADGNLQITEVPGGNRTVFQIFPKATKPKDFRYGRDAQQIPLTDDVITQIIPLNSMVEAEDVRRPSLMQVSRLWMPGPQPVQVLIDTDTSANVHRYVEQLNQLAAAPHVRIAIENRRLTKLNAADVAKSLNARFPSFSPIAATATRPGQEFHLAVELQDRLYADFNPRTNAVVLLGSAELVKQALDTIDREESHAATTSAPGRTP